MRAALISALLILIPNSFSNYNLDSILQKRAETQIKYSMSHDNRSAQELLKNISQTSQIDQVKLSAALNEIRHDLSEIRSNLNQKTNYFAWLPSLGSIKLNYAHLILGFLTLILLSSALSVIKPNSRRAAAKTKTNYDLEDNEYDFIDSIEGLPSKLDLARAFIQMNELEDAKRTLNEIIRAKDPKFTAIANDLLNSIK